MKQSSINIREPADSGIESIVDGQSIEASAKVSGELPKMTDQGLESIHKVASRNQFGEEQEINIVDEIPLTIKIDGEELVTLMTLGTHPEKLVLGYLRNQTLFEDPREIKSVEVDWGRELAEVTTVDGEGVKGIDTSRRTVTTGCGQGTILSCTLDKLYDHRLPEVEVFQSDIYRVLGQIKDFNRAYRIAGSVHGCGLCRQGEVLIFIEDVGRHNAMDTISGEMWLQGLSGNDKIFYTTGRLTSEIVMKAALMGIPVLVSRNGTTNMGLELARDLGVTLIARAKSRQFVALNADNLVYDAIPGGKPLAVN
jgi:FdhD protein